MIVEWKKKNNNNNYQKLEIDFYFVEETISRWTSKSLGRLLNDENLIS